MDKCPSLGVYKPDYTRVAAGNVAGLAMLGAFWTWKCVAPDNLCQHCREDGILENLTALFFLAASIAISVAVWRYPFVRASKRRMVFPLCWALLFFVFAGEEISWGQRVFGLETPEALAQVNKQNGKTSAI